MANLSDTEKAALVADFQSFAIDDWQRPLFIYQEAQRTIVSADPNYSPFKSLNQNATNVTNTPVKYTVSGRILWDKNQDRSFIAPYPGRGADEAQLKVKDQITRACRIKVDPSGYNVMLNAKLVEVDGVQLVPQSQPRPHGLFWPTHYSFYYVRNM